MKVFSVLSLVFSIQIFSQEVLVKSAKFGLGITGEGITDSEYGVDSGELNLKVKFTNPVPLSLLEKRVYYGTSQDVDENAFNALNELFQYPYAYKREDGYYHIPAEISVEKLALRYQNRAGLGETASKELASTVLPELRKLDYQHPSRPGYYFGGQFLVVVEYDKLDDSLSKDFWGSLPKLSSRILSACRLNEAKELTDDSFDKANKCYSEEIEKIFPESSSNKVIVPSGVSANENAWSFLRSEFLYCRELTTGENSFRAQIKYSERLLELERNNPGVKNKMNVIKYECMTLVLEGINKN